MVSFVSCFKQLVLVWLRAKESDFVAGKGPFIGKKRNALLEKVNNLDVKPGRDYLINCTLQTTNNRSLLGWSLTFWRFDYIVVNPKTTK